MQYVFFVWLLKQIQVEALYIQYIDIWYNIYIYIVTTLLVWCHLSSIFLLERYCKCSFISLRWRCAACLSDHSTNMCCATCICQAMSSPGWNKQCLFILLLTKWYLYTAPPAKLTWPPTASNPRLASISCTWQYFEHPVAMEQVWKTIERLSSEVMSCWIVYRLHSLFFHCALLFVEK